ncbi:hypothetical protein [Microbacterium sp. UFMG61]|uniref:hypothetical protein n=1 Tax=Microbacterium sp. UFMG61 TaxID=2745935 RepID=UPI00188E7D71|nr:hypothetical protein [Microbacterium sp. UFMG61]
MKIRHVLSAAAAIVLAGALVAAPASASTDDSGIEVEQIPGLSQEDVQQREELFALAETQTPEEVQELIAEGAATGAPLEILFDVESGVEIAARPSEEAPVAARAIDMKCLDNPAKLYVQAGGGRQAIYCFRGTGVYNGTWGAAFKISAGAYTTTAWYGTNLTQAYFATPGNTTVFSSAVTVGKITRS